MGIKLSTNFDIGAPVPVDSKLVVSTKAGLTTINENIWPEGYLTICLEDKQLYIFNKTNEVDAETGKFRKVAADIDTSLFEKKAQGFMTLAQYNALKEAGHIIEDVDYYIEDMGCPHKQPSRLPQGYSAIYIYLCMSTKMNINF